MEASFIIETEDIPYEEEILRHPYTLKCWLRYIEHKRNAPDSRINWIYERALKELPGSYKLWYNYMKLRKEQVAKKRLDDPQYEEVNATFERALIFMHKMPRIWLEYLHFLVDQGFITRTRRTFDRALRSLPITQAYRIWKLYLEFLNLYPDLTETVVRCYRRYLKLAPEDSEDFIDYLIKVDRLDEAASVLVKIINDDSFNSKHGKSKHQLWDELCKLISNNPDKVTSHKIEPIIRQGIDKYQDQVGILWNYLATYYARSKLNERTRDIYEEAMNSVTKVSDFTLIFDAYVDVQQKFLEDFLNKNADEDDEEKKLEMEYLFCRCEDLVARRDLLQNSVCLRQNPHNVDHWLRRVRLYEGQTDEVIRTYTKALETINPKEASGKLYLLWTDFANFYENAGQIDEARTIFDKGMNIKFNNVVELANLVLKRVEMEERHRNYKEALRVLQKAVVPVAGMVDYHDNNEQVQNRLFKSHKVWEKLAELEQAFGTYASCKSVYSRMMDLRIATPQDIVNCALFHEDMQYFEESFKAYERGISLFGWPNVNEIWKTYLQKFMERYKGKKLERTRDLFEQCLEKCPAKYAKPFYLMYAKLEEDNGQVGQAMAIYDRATSGVPVNEQYEMFNIYLKKASKLNDIIATRPIFKKAIENLPLSQSVEMGLRYAEQETKIGEIDRARALYTQCSEGCDPKIFGKFWEAWKDFEMQHGNDNTLTEMLRVKRSVMASTNTQMNCLTAQKLLVSKRNHEDDEEVGDSMRNLEKKARMMMEEAALDQPMKAVSFVRSETTTEELGEMTKTNNPDEINIADDDEEEGEANDEVILEKKEIPSTVFGKFIPKTDDD